MARSFPLRIVAVTILVPVAAAALAGDTLRVFANTVVPIVMEDELNVRINRPGDRFRARVEDSRELPYGTRLEGVVLESRRAERDRPAFMDVEFKRLILPDGRRVDIRAVPISLDSRAIRRDRDGRLTADRSKIKSEHYVVGGLVGGLLLGSAFKKPFEGAFLGTLAGILLAEGERGKNKGDVVAKNGQRMGALFERDVTVEFDGRDNRYGYRRDDDRYDRYDRDGDADRDERDRYDDRWERVPAEQTLDLTHRGRTIRFDRDRAPFEIEGTWMVPLEDAASRMDLEVENSTRTNSVLVMSGSHMLRFERDSDRYRLDGRQGTLPRPMVERNGVWYVPLRVLASAVEGEVVANGIKLEPLDN